MVMEDEGEMVMEDEGEMVMEERRGRWRKEAWYLSLFPYLIHRVFKKHTGVRGRGMEGVNGIIQLFARFYLLPRSNLFTTNRKKLWKN